MKNFKRIAYIVLILIVAILSFSVYTNANKENSNGQEKTFTKLKYLESKLINLMNTMNNINTKNYEIEVGNLSKEATEQATGGNSSNQGGQGSQGSSSSGGGQSSQGGQSQGGNNSGSSNSQDEQNQKKFDLKLSGVLTNNEEVNWDYVKNEVELLYTSIPTITLDMYQLQINKEDILNFNQELDNLAIVVKNENKEETLAQLSKMYEFLPKFFESTTDENWYKIVADTKDDIFKAYSRLDSQNWIEIGNDVQNAINEYTKLMSETDIIQEKQYSINKGYIMINELQNAVNSQDISIFLIKYKNLIEEIDNL